jgi:N6-adenosine-specific RNA methylase IME4
MKQFDVICADPPWAYDDKQVAGERGAGFHYQTMRPDEIAELPVGKLAADDCALFLWTTCPQLDVALRVMAAWGFTYKTVAFVWEKRTTNGKLHWGMGSYTRANAELVLLGVRGRPKRESAGVHQIVQAKVREHSQKPDEVYQAIEELMAGRRRLELFARAVRPGWTVLGNAIDGRDIRDVLREMGQQ